MKFASLSVPYLFSHLSQAFVHCNTFAFVHQNNILSFYSHLHHFIRVSLHERGAQCSMSHFVSSLPCLRTLFPVHVHPCSCMNVKCALNLLRHCHHLSRCYVMVGTFARLEQRSLVQLTKQIRAVTCGFRVISPTGTYTVTDEK